MPNLDGGHYFLTVLAPVRVDAAQAVHADAPFQATHSPVQRLAHTLAVMPVGRQTSKSPAKGPRSPFSRNARNHTARFTIIESPNFNGRHSGDTLLDRSNPLTPQHVDRLAVPYLLFAADIDAGHDAEASLRAYTDELWATMGEELQAIFSHCYGFEAVADAAAFHAYIKRCQVETSLSFNDYWADNMPTGKDWLKVKPLELVAKITAVITVVWLILLIVNAGMMFVMFLGLASDLVLIFPVLSTLGLFVVVPLILVVAAWAYWTYSRVLMHGRRPFPVAPNSDLPSILKALYVQQAYVRFVIASQGLPPDAMHARFTAFLDTVRPDAPKPALTPGECYPELWR